MPTVSSGSILWNGLLASVTELIADSWKPGPCAKELGYRDSLLLFLRTALPPEVLIEQEYRHQGTTTDLFIRSPGGLFSSEMFIEIKHNLCRKAECDRLLGQVDRLRRSNAIVLILLVGTPSISVSAWLGDHYKAGIDSGEIRIVSMDVIQ